MGACQDRSSVPISLLTPPYFTIPLQCYPAECSISQILPMMGDSLHTEAIYNTVTFLTVKWSPLGLAKILSVDCTNCSSFLTGEISFQEFGVRVFRHAE